MSHVTSLRISTELKEKLETIAKYHDRKPNWVINKALETFIEREAEEIRFLKERSRLAEEDRKTGRLVLADEVISNLRKHIQARKTNGNS